MMKINQKPILEIMNNLNLGETYTNERMEIFYQIPSSDLQKIMADLLNEAIKIAMDQILMELQKQSENMKKSGLLEQLKNTLKDLDKRLANLEKSTNETAKLLNFLIEEEIEDLETINTKNMGNGAQNTQKK